MAKLEGSMKAMGISAGAGPDDEEEDLLGDDEEWVDTDANLNLNPKMPPILTSPKASRPHRSKVPLTLSKITDM